MSQVTSINVTSALLAWGFLHYMSQVIRYVTCPIFTGGYQLLHTLSHYFLFHYMSYICHLSSLEVCDLIYNHHHIRSKKSQIMLHVPFLAGTHHLSRLTNVTNHTSPVIYRRETQIQIHLSCLQVDNRGNRLIVTDDSDINTPAVAAAYAIKRYSKQAQDEISFEVRKCLVVVKSVMQSKEYRNILWEWKVIQLLFGNISPMYLNVGPNPVLEDRGCGSPSSTERFSWDKLVWATQTNLKPTFFRFDRFETVSFL